MRITVFTPTYNRGYRIDHLYQSLRRQTFTDFEWVVVDDGSTDDTRKQFELYRNERNDFPITYLQTENGGKHRAINRGVSAAKGELFFIVDSDDYLTDTALESIDRIEKTIPHGADEKFGGVCGLRGYSENSMIGKTFDGELLDIRTLDRPKYGIYGDKAEVFYTEILKRYPFPEYPGEKFMTECVVWDKIAADGYKLRFFNEIIYICDYLPDGLTAHSAELFAATPKGYGLYLYQSALFEKITGVERWNKYLEYFYQFRDKMKFSEIASNLHMNPIKLYIRLFGIRLFYKLYG